jgi:hypothetical protein
MSTKKVLIILGFIAISIHLLGSLPAYLDNGINGMGLGFMISAAIVYFFEKKKK